MEMHEKEQRNLEESSRKLFSVSYPDEVSSTVVPEVDHGSDDPSADFEEAIEATGYGYFNILLLLAAMPAGLASAFDVTAMAYILPAAECDLDLSFFDKGVLNAVIYLGMISSGFGWGFLADKNGRRSLLIWGFTADTICTAVGSMSQSFYVLAMFRLLNGFIITGPFSINMTYLAEFHGVKYRSRAMLWAGIFTALANAVLPILAWLIIPQSWSFTLFDGAFVYNSWRIFILVSGTPSLLASLMLIFLPESPKFLMSQDRNDEALKVFRRMYAVNTGNLPEQFPVKSLCLEGQKTKLDRSDSRQRISVWEKTRKGWAQITPLFQKPHRFSFLIIITISFGTILSMNTLRLWTPQLFTLMENFDYRSRDPSLSAPTLCEMISVPNPLNGTPNTTTTDTCVPTPITDRVYINSIIIASTWMFGCTLAGSLVNLIGKKNLLLTIFVISMACSIGLNWSPNSGATLGILSIFMAVTGLSVNVIVSFTVDLMPTSLRTMAVSLAMMTGRIGAMLGNLLFPILLTAGCMVPFIFVGVFLLVCFVLSILIPRPPSRLV